MSEESQQPLNDLPTSTAEASDPSQNCTTELKKTDSPTPQIEEPGNNKSLTRGGSDGRLWRTEKKKIALDNLESDLGGRDSVIDIIAMGSLDKKQEHLLRLLCDPARANDSVVTICRDAGLNPEVLFDLLHKGSTHIGTARALVRMGTKLPEVASDIIEKSIDAKVECPNCFGEGYIAEDVKCPQCVGRGEVFRPSDIDRQKMIAEATGLLKKGPGVQINQATQINNNMSAPSLFSKYVKQSDEAAYDVVDATVEEVK